MTAINMSRIWIEWAEWAALCFTANSPFPGQVYCRHPVYSEKDNLGVIFTHQFLLIRTSPISDKTLAGKQDVS